MSLIWTQAALEPKRKFKYLVTFTGLPDFQFLAQTCDRPGLKVGSSEHKYFDKTYYHPGRVTWEPNPLNIKLVDIQRNGETSKTDTNETLLNVFVASGLSGLIQSSGEVRTIGKESATLALGAAKIRVLNASLNPSGQVTNDVDNNAIVAGGEGGIAEQWELKNAWLESFKPDALDYGAEDILTVTMTVRYDWAEFITGEQLRTDASKVTNKFG